MRAASRAMNRTQPQRVEAFPDLAYGLGEGGLLGHKRLAVICSQRCPGDVNPKTYGPCPPSSRVWRRRLERAPFTPLRKIACQLSFAAQDPLPMEVHRTPTRWHRPLRGARPKARSWRQSRPGAFPCEIRQNRSPMQFPFDSEWRGRRYATKQVEAYAVEENG
jgi:hypothetical protein